MHLEQECNTIPWPDLGLRHHKLESRALSLSHPMQSLNKNEAPKEIVNVHKLTWRPCLEG